MKIKLTVVILLIALTAGLGFCEKYVNPRFGFSLDIPDEWMKYENPAPENGDGFSFNLPENACFSASGSYNVMENSLEDECKSRVGDEKLLESKKIKIDGCPAIMMVTAGKNLKTLQAVTIKEDTIYTVHYNAPAKVFDKNRARVEKIIPSFRILQ